jgi:hypothetical protein
MKLYGAITQHTAVLNFTAMKISKYQLQPDSCLKVTHILHKCFIISYAK